MRPPPRFGSVLPLLYLWAAKNSADAITADEILLNELAWAERRIRMFRHGFGDRSSAAPEGGISLDADALVGQQNRHDSGSKAKAEGGPPHGVSGGP